VHFAYVNFSKIVIPKTSALGQCIDRIRDGETVVSFFFTKQLVRLHECFLLPSATECKVASGLAPWQWRIGLYDQEAWQP
jgi:hypothetical protein